MAATDFKRVLTVNLVSPIHGLVNWLGAADQADAQYTFDDPAHCSSITIHDLGAACTDRNRANASIASAFSPPPAIFAHPRPHKCADATP